MSWVCKLVIGLNSDSRLAEFKKAAGDRVEPFNSVFTCIPEGTEIYNDKLQYLVPVSWDNQNGRDTLAGDAAHLLLPCATSKSSLRYM